MAGSRAPAVKARELRVSYRGRRSLRRREAPIEALRGLDLEVAGGEIHGLLGPNAAGKTTLCRILATVLLPSSGSAEVFGFDVVSQVQHVRRRIGIVFGGDRGLYPRLTAQENLRFWAALYGVPAAARRPLAERLLKRVGLRDRADERVEVYSRGMRQRLHLARGLVGNPALLLLDEPTAGMDPGAAHEFRTLVGELRAEGRTILLATHNMTEAEHVCDRVTLISDGAVVATSRPLHLAARLRAGRRIEADGVPEHIVAELAAIPGITVVTPLEQGQLRLEACEATAPLALRRLVDAGVVSLRSCPPDLEETYLALVGQHGLAITR